MRRSHLSCLMTLRYSGTNKFALIVLEGKTIWQRSNSEQLWWARSKGWSIGQRLFGSPRTAAMAGWDSDLGDNNTQNSHPANATYRRKNYEPFRWALCVPYNICLIDGE